MVVKNEAEFRAVLKELENYYGRLTELYLWASRFYLVSAIFMLISVPVVLFVNWQGWCAGVSIGMFCQIIAWTISSRAEKLKRELRDKYGPDA